MFCPMLVAKASHLTRQIAAKVVADLFKIKFQNSARYLGN